MNFSFDWSDGFRLIRMFQGSISVVVLCCMVFRVGFSDV